MLVLGRLARVEVLGRLGLGGGLLGHLALSLGLDGLLGRLTLGLELGGLLGRLALDLGLGGRLGRLALGLGGRLGDRLGRLTLDWLLAHSVPLSRLAILELLELLARGEIFERLVLDPGLNELLGRLVLDLGRLALGLGLGGLLGRLTLVLGLGGLLGRLALDVPLVGLGLHSLRQLVRLEFAQGPELLGAMRDGVQQARSDQRVVVVHLVVHDVDESLLDPCAEYGLEVEEFVTGVLEHAYASLPDLRDRDELGCASPLALTSHASAVLLPCFARLICYILGESRGMEWVVGVGLEPDIYKFAHPFLVVQLSGRKQAVPVLDDVL
jgi:hypothetical protein